MDVNGIHEVGLDYCGCETAQTATVQLLRSCLFPATFSNPKTAATFALLLHFLCQNFQSKASALQFCQGLMQETDNTGLMVVKVSNFSDVRVLLLTGHRIATSY
jgi:hypothetical protein